MSSKVRSFAFVVDHGAGTIKANLGTEQNPRLLPNCITKAKNLKSRAFIADQLNECKDLSGLYYQYAFQKGYLVNWETEKQIWDYMLGPECFDISNNLSEATLMLSEPPFNFNQLRDPAIEVVFEEMGFGKLFCTIPALYSHIQNSYGSEKSRPGNNSISCSLIVDSGFSFSHVIPCCNNRVIAEGIRRLEIGGKLLTNHLKEIISYRQLMVMEETNVVNTLKEDISFVSKDMIRDLNLCRKDLADNPYVLDYVLPDFMNINRGMMLKPGEPRPEYFTGHEQILRLCNERFSVPELLFRPSDVGIDQMGISEAIVHSIMSLPEEFHPHLFANIVLTGGNVCIPGFSERLQQEVRCLTSDTYTVNITTPEDPTSYAWQGARTLALTKELSSTLKSALITKNDYAENGTRYCTDVIEKFTYGGTVNC